MGQMTRIVSMIAVLAAFAVPTLAQAAPAAAAAAGRVRPAMVLVNQPAATVCVGATFKVGVWYQQFSGGSRAYRVAVYNPAGKRILYRHGRAPSAQWKFWKIRPKLVGKYHTVYSGHWHSASKWSKYRATTRAHRC
jgi:hypothetical protein